MPISEARHRANEKYNAKAYDEIKLRVRSGEKENIQAAASEQGESVNAYIYRAIVERMERERVQGGGNYRIDSPIENEKL